MNSDDDDLDAELNEELLAYMSQAFNVSREEEADHGRTEADDDDSSVESRSSRGSSRSSFYSSGTLNDDDGYKDKEEDENDFLEGGLILKYSKICIFLSVAMIAIMGALTSAFLIQDQENEVLEEHTNELVSQIVSRSQKNLELAFTATRSMSRTIATTGSSPFVTLSHFEMYGGEARDLARSQLIAHLPLVRNHQVKAWEQYSQDNQGWIAEGLHHEGITNEPGSIPEKLYTRTLHSHENETTEVHAKGYHFPIWQMASAPRNASIVNLDLGYDSARLEHDMVDAMHRRKPLFSSVQDLRYLTKYSNSVNENDKDEESTNTDESSLSLSIRNPMAASEQPQQSYILQPIFDSIEAYVNDNGYDSSTSPSIQKRSVDLATDVVGFVLAVLDWKTLFSDILPPAVEGISVVVDDGCGEVLTFEVNGPNAYYRGKGDRHNPDHDALLFTLNDFGGLVASGFESVVENHPEVNGTTYNDRYEGSRRGHCEYTLKLYEAGGFDTIYSSNSHVIPAAVIGVMILFIFLILFFYDCITSRRQRHLLSVARQTNKLISTLFPKDVQRRIFEEAAAEAKPKFPDMDEYDEALGDESQGQLESMVTKEKRKKAIADYFPNATIIFADIVGFTAWSSTRDPSQVFQLLETIYHAFDEIAKKRRVFKVETVGDCYVAATGLPEARTDHAVVMARFARDCLKEFQHLVREMEETLGPDTADLGLRVGLNSGPVTAGVLRGERSRFQLFGDTVNTAARMESNGAKNRIHISKETAELLIQAGKQKWLHAREDKIVAKGKGELQTYWLDSRRNRAVSESARSSAPSSSAPTSENGEEDMDDHVINEAKPSRASGSSDKLSRLVKWNTELLAQSLQLIIARRVDTGAEFADADEIRNLEYQSRAAAREGKLVLDEVVEVINLPQKSLSLSPGEEPTDPDHVQLSGQVMEQLHDFVRTIAAMYRGSNPFHNFEHASHVTMSTSKLLARIVAPEEATGGYAMRQNLIDEDVSLSTNKVQDTTYGITSDPLTQFASVFVALIHDVDHPGVPNSTLVKEGTGLAAIYQNKSVAEQNSIDLAWDLFMDTAYDDLRRALYVNKEEFERFRLLVANLTLATDIMDKELGAFRKARWNKAFDKDSLAGRLADGSCDKNADVNRKATIVLEHLIQASDVSHTMQHWHIFSKWNQRLFDEMYLAYREGRAEVDPSENWYKSEIGFFDFYIIPLAKKLENCGVFGVSSDEYLAYAQRNRDEWEARGEEMVKMYLEAHKERVKAIAEAENISQEVVKEAEEVANEVQVEQYVKDIMGMLEAKQQEKDTEEQEESTEMDQPEAKESGIQGGVSTKAPPSDGDEPFDGPEAKEREAPVEEHHVLDTHSFYFN